MERPQVVNRRTAEQRAGDVYIGRPSRFGNPFVVGKDGTRRQVIERFRNEAMTEVMVKSLAALEPRRLVCWCAPLPCHGDVLADALQELNVSLEMNRKKKG